MGQRASVGKNEVMGLLGDIAKGILILTVAYWVFSIINFFLIGQAAIALLLLFVLMIPLSMIAHEYLKNRKKERT